jgi:hypothetical protein
MLPSDNPSVVNSAVKTGSLIFMFGTASTQFNRLEFISATQLTPLRGMAPQFQFLNEIRHNSAVGKTRQALEEAEIAC